MTLLERMAAIIIRGRATRDWGVPPNLINEMVTRLGAIPTLRWFARNLPRYKNTLKLWGPLRTHLVCIEASLANGCAYCTHAHAYAFELAYFQERGALFPLDEHEIVQLRNGTDEERHAALTGALHQVGLPDEIAVLDHLWRLKISDGVAATDEERRMKHLLEMFDVLNYCAIDSRTQLDEAHDPINKDDALKLRYAEARFAAPERQS
jgi:hypothetical protein